MDWPIVTVAAANQGRAVTQLLQKFTKKYSKENLDDNMKGKVTLLIKPLSTSLGHNEQLTGEAKVNRRCTRRMKSNTSISAQLAGPTLAYDYM